jgi:hypothetical protein
MRKEFWTFAVLAVLSVPAGAQTVQRRATFQGGESPNEGKCTIEVVVDTAAEVEVRGDNAVLRTVAGQPAQWRRFVCTGRMPDNPANFRFKGIDGRGRQDLIRDPRSGGAAVVRIEDRDGGSEGYTFDLIWTGSGSGYTGQGGLPPREGYPNAREGFPGGRDGVPGDRGGFQGDRGAFPGDRDGFPGDRDQDRNRAASRFTAEQAIRVCQEGVRQRAYDRFGRADIAFQRTAIDDNPGRNDWVVGAIEVRRGRRADLFQFSCSVNFENGSVRSVQLDPLDRDRR